MNLLQAMYDHEVDEISIEELEAAGDFWDNLQPSENEENIDEWLERIHKDVV